MPLTPRQSVRASHTAPYTPRHSACLAKSDLVREKSPGEIHGGAQIPREPHEEARSSGNATPAPAAAQPALAATQHPRWRRRSTRAGGDAVLPPPRAHRTPIGRIAHPSAASHFLQRPRRRRRAIPATARAPPSRPREIRPETATSAHGHLAHALHLACGRATQGRARQVNTGRDKTAQDRAER